MHRFTAKDGSAEQPSLTKMLIALLKQESHISVACNIYQALRQTGIRKLILIDP